MTKLYVVGIGPGDYDNMTVRADRALQGSDIIIGYQVYVKLVRERYPGKEFRTAPMTKEAERCRMALSAAREGKTAALICSGDSGVYGLAALVLELRGENPEPELEIVPGLTAACGGAALLGAPLTHDFAVISLSDRLTPWEAIEMRLEAAARADFSIALYNPASRGRPDHLRRACDVLLRHLPETRPCGVARCVGRDGERREYLTLRELRDYPADMFCTVFIGNAATRMVAGSMVTPRGYPDAASRPEEAENRR